MTIDFVELGERVGKATGADRELDEALFEEFVRKWTGLSQDAARHMAPEYTASIDAALGLVERMFGPEAPALCYSYDLGWAAQGSHSCSLHLAIGNPAVNRSVHGHAETMPLAIILAALKSLSEKTNELE